jgi:hypothetical protein
MDGDAAPIFSISLPQQWRARMADIENFYICQNSFSYCRRIAIAALSPNMGEKRRAPNTCQKSRARIVRVVPALVFFVFLLLQGFGTDMLRRLSPWRELQARGTISCDRRRHAWREPASDEMQVMKIGRAFFLAAIFFSSSAFAQPRDRSRDPPPKPASRGMDFCKADIHKFCEAADLKQECLVAHWSKISSRCQDVLAAPMHDGGDSRN